MRRALIIIASIIVLVGIGVVVYFTFFNAQPHLTVGASSNAFGDTGAGTVAANPVSGGGPSGNTSSGTVVGPNFVKITSAPVAAGMIAFDIAPKPILSTTPLSTSTSASSTVSTTNLAPADTEVRYIDRESGNVYAYRVQARTLARISNKTLPGIQEASWLPDGSASFVRFLTQTNGVEQVNTYELPADGTGGYFLQQNLAQASVLGPTTIFTFAAGSDSSIGSTANVDGTGAKTLFTSPLTSLWVYPAGTSIIAVTKASAQVDGYAFSFSSGKFTPILGPLRALTVLPSPSGKLLLYSYYTDGSVFQMLVLDLTTGAVTHLPVATFAQKCVWTTSNDALYCAIPKSFFGTLPDDWYQGVVSTNDRIWRIDLSSRLATLILDPSQTGKVDIDAVNLTLDPNVGVLVFRNKKDSSLWAYNL